MAMKNFNRDKMREANERSIRESMKTKEAEAAENSVDLAIKEMEKQENLPEPADTGTAFREVPQDPDVSMHIQRGSNRSVKKYAKSVRLTETAFRKMTEAAKAYNISANDLINQLLEQL